MQSLMLLMPARGGCAKSGNTRWRGCTDPSRRCRASIDEPKNRQIGVDSHFHTALANQDPALCCQTGCSDRAPTRLHWEYRARVFFKQMNLRPCIHPVSRQLFASLWDSLLLLKRVEQKEGKRSKAKQALLVHVCTITWPLERGEALTSAPWRRWKKTWRSLLRTPVLQDLLWFDEAGQKASDTHILS